MLNLETLPVIFFWEILQKFVIIFIRMKKTVNAYQEYSAAPHNLYYAEIANLESGKMQMRKELSNGLITGNSSTLVRPETPTIEAQNRTSGTPKTPSEAPIKKSLQQSQTKASKQQSNISSSRSDKFLQITELQMQIQKLNAEHIEKNKQIKYLQKANEKKKAELVELQKNVSYYQGRLTMMEDQLIAYERVFSQVGKECDGKSKYKSQVQELVQLFQGLRKQNQAVNGRYEEKCYQLNKLTQKYLKLKNKLKQQGLLRKLPQKTQSNQDTNLPRHSSSQSKIINRVYELNEQQKARQTVIKSLNLKISEIESKIAEISKQNQKLFSDLQQKQQTILKLSKQLQYFKHGRSQKSLEKVGRIRRHSKKRLHSLILPEVVSSNAVQNSNQEYQMFKVGSSNVQEKQKQSSLLDKDIAIEFLFRKLRFNLISEELHYETVLETIARNQHSFQYFTKAPYGLNCMEAQVLVRWVAQLSNSTNKHKVKQILAEHFHKYKQLNIKHLYKTKTNIYNAFQNRLYESLTENNLSKTVRFNEIQKMLREEWGFKEEEIDVVMKGYFQYTGELEWINLITLGDVVEKWHNL